MFDIFVIAALIAALVLLGSQIVSALQILWIILGDNGHNDDQE